MKRNLLTALLMLVGILGNMAGPRAERLLSDGWTFYPAYDVSKKPNVQTVSVPHSWNLRDVFNGMKYDRGTYIYEHSLPKDASMQGKRVFLKFDAVCSVADVMVNQHTVGHHAGGYTAFSMEVTHELKEGDNKLSVVASNAYRTDVAPLAGDFNLYGGITRPVHLIVTGPDCISPLDCASTGVYVHPTEITPKKARCTIETVLSLTTGTQGKQLRCSIIDAGGRCVAENTSAVSGERMMQNLTVTNPHLWNGRQDPYIYKVKVELLDNGNVVDEVTDETGFRYFNVDPDQGFMLNGRHLDLHGVCRHEEAYGTGSLLNEKALEQDAQIIDDMGATGVRFVHYPHSRQDVEQYSKRGIVVWYELNLAGPGGYSSPGYVSNNDLEAHVMQNLEEMIKQNYNAPAICMWSLCNELSFKYDEPATFLRKLNERAKQLDPSRLTTLAICYSQDGFQHITDLLGWNKYFGWYTSDKNVGDFLDQARKEAWPQPVGLCEYGAAGSPLKHAFNKKSTNFVHYEEDQARVHEDNWKQLSVRPWVWCKFIWQYSDNPSSIRNEGDARGINDKGMVTYDRKTKKDSYFFYQANWTSTPMLYIASRRYIERTEPVTDIKVYTNQPQATLYLNGKKVATGKKDGLGRVVFKNIRLRDGKNTVRVTSGKLTDSCVWTLDVTKKSDDRPAASQTLDGAV